MKPTQRTMIYLSTFILSISTILNSNSSFAAEEGRKTIATANAKVGGGYDLELETRTTCVQQAKVCVGWKNECAKWARVGTLKTCVGWKATCANWTESCTGWKTETRRLHHQPRVVVTAEGITTKTLEIKVKEAMEQAAVIAAIAGFVTGDFSTAVSTFTESFKTVLEEKLKNLEVIKLNIKVEEKTEWTNWK